MTERQRWLILAGALGTGVLVYLLAPVLTPFLIGAALAYIGDPLADWLEARKFSRTAAVITVFTGMLVLLLPLPFLLVPLLEQQIATLISKLPGYLEWVRQTLLPWLRDTVGIEQADLELGQLEAAIREHWKQVGGVAAGVLGYVSRSGMALLVVVANLLLIPVVTFYLLRDWDVLVSRMRELLPRSVEPTAVVLAKECDTVLGEFVRGQLLVMVALGTVYSVGLSIVGLDLAILIGLGAGLVSFVPYLGFIVGIVVAGVAAVLQFQDFIHVIFVVIVFGVGQALEGVVLQPLLLGDRIGLHPVAVIFAVMAGGQLFGFVGVLLALPAAAIVMVLLRHAYRQYVCSEMYGGSP